MAKPIFMPEDLIEMQFPLGGINVSTEFELQPPGTTPTGQNVRAYEPGTMRSRGGARQGLSQYIPQRVNGAHLIQHLNYVVDPTDLAVLDQFDSTDTDAVDDPSTNSTVPGVPARNPGRKVRRGGSGRQSNRNKMSKTAGFKRVQNNFVFGGPASSSIVFTSNVTKGNLIIFVMWLHAEGGSSITPGVPVFSDNAGNSYTQVGSTLSYTGNDGIGFYSGSSFSMFFAVANTTGPLTITFSSSSLSAIGSNTWILEYSGNSSIPFDGSNSQLISGDGGFNEPFSGSSVPVTGPIAGAPGDLVVGAFFDCSGGSVTTAGFSSEFPTAGLVASNLNVRSNAVIQGTAPSPWISFPDGTNWNYFIGASFKPHM